MSDTPDIRDVMHAAQYRYSPGQCEESLAAHGAQALREAADEIHVSLQQAHKRAGRTLDPMFSQHDQGLCGGYKNAESWLRARANHIEQGGQP